MKIIKHDNENKNIYEITSDKIILNDVQDALDLMANAGPAGKKKIILYEKNITADFFNLSTRLAGDVLQKFTNYMVELAIIGDFEKYKSESLKAFIYESNKGAQINFVDDITKAIK
jgi:hypothetical protein